ncbi:MAG: hypothetical protein HC927_07655 [Deltaproteobacteria bacterium]|nr:hypothetical protein [Deltaproteobacteria bacterium]
MPAGGWDTLELHIGVDPEPNASLDAIAGELMPGIGMDWSWDTGYKFFRAEGEIADGGERFVIHTGGDPLYKRLQAQLDQPLALERGESTQVVLEADVDRLFVDIDLAESPEILGGPVDSLAGKVAGGIGRGWRQQHMYPRAVLLHHRADHRIIDLVHFLGQILQRVAGEQVHMRADVAKL